MKNRRKKAYSNSSNKGFSIRGPQKIEMIKRISKVNILISEVSVPSLCVGYEIVYAEKFGKDVLCIYDNGSEKNFHI